MSKYNDANLVVPQENRADINDKILYLITNGIVEQSGFTASDIYNCYTGNGGLHGLDMKDFNNFHDYSQAKKEVELGQFFTPHSTCKFLVDCIRPTKKDIIYDLTFGIGNFFNYLPEEANIYGAEIDIKAFKVANYLYPAANLVHEDIRSYDAPVKADIVLGNPPFNLDFGTSGENITSQMFICKKAAEILKPAGLLALIVPNSFLSDEFSNKSDIEKINYDFNFVVQFDLNPEIFKHVGVASFHTKVLVLQKKSRYLPTREYSIAKENAKTSEYIYSTYILPLLKEKDRLAGKLYFEGKNEEYIRKDFMDKVKKYLYDIKRHPKLSSKSGKCESYLNQYLTQKQPPHMSYDVWKENRINSKDVLAFLKKVLSSANTVYKNEKRTVKTNYGFYEKDYSEKAEHGNICVKKGYGLFTKEYTEINDCVLNGYTVEGFESLLKRKKRAFDLQSQTFEDMQIDPAIEGFLKAWGVYSETNEEILKLTETQAEDTNKLLQKRYGILQYSMGAGKTLCGLAMAQYQLLHTNIRNVFVVGTAIAINNTWEVVLEDYNIDFKRIQQLSDIYEIKDKQIVIITLEMIIKFQKWLKRYVRSKSQKIMLLFDEGDAISNPFSKRTKAMLSIFRKCKYKYETTGTTTRNNICEIAPQLELLYNNSINYLSKCYCIYHTGKDGTEKTSHNWYCDRPIPAYREGYKLFSKSHLPKKITVFGADQMTQDIYNADELKELLDKTVITKSFEEVTGKKIYEINQITVPFHSEERRIYKLAIDEFERLRLLYFSKHENARKDSMMKILQQLILLLKVCADPSGISGYSSTIKPTKITKMLSLLNQWENERVAIGVRHVSVVNSYARYIKAEFPNRPIFIVTGGETTFKRRRDIIKKLEQTENGILISTQQSLSASTNIDFVDKVVLPELHYNNAAMSQYYFRFIRFSSKNFKNVYFLTYENTIESNLLKMVLVKEKLNLFMKNEVIDDDELYERFGVDPAIISCLMSKEYDDKGNVRIRWGEQKIVQ